MSRPPLILAYHGVADVSARHDPARLFTAPRRFRAHVRSLIRRGYEFVRVTELARQIRAGSGLAGTCALTFDDGSEDNATILAPTLLELGVPGTLYVCPGLLGRTYPWCDPAAGIRFMTAGELVELAGEPLIEIGSHTREHRLLESATAEEAYREMASSKRQLEELIGVEVSSFAYPHGKYSPVCPAAARRAGYTSAVATDTRGRWDPYRLRREPMWRADGPLTFALKSRGLYDGTRRLAAVRLGGRMSRPYRHRAKRA